MLNFLLIPHDKHRLYVSDWKKQSKQLPEFQGNHTDTVKTFMAGMVPICTLFANITPTIFGIKPFPCKALNST